MNATANTVQPLTVNERKARLAALVNAGKVSQQDADRMDIREATPREIAFGKTLVPLARAALARHARAVA